jgi:sortase A
VPAMKRWAKALEWLLLICGLLMVGIYVGASIHRSVLSRAEVERFKDQVLVNKELDGGPEVEGKKPDFSLWSAKRVKSYQESLAAHFAPALALLRIPKIDLEVPILEGTDDLSLNRAVGHIVGTPRPGESGNVGIAGHRDGFFRGLKDVNTGDTVEIVTPDNVNKFVIDEITIVDPADVSVLAPRAQPSVTLVTCYPFYFIGSAPQRYIVRASLVTTGTKKVEASDAKSF